MNSSLTLRIVDPEDKYPLDAAYPSLERITIILLVYRNPASCERLPVLCFEMDKLTSEKQRATSRQLWD